MEKRRDYKKMMNAKKRNKQITKLTIFASLGVGIAIANNTIAQAEEWKPNTSTTIKQGDKEYVIKWGDYLELISNETGITQETLQQLNNIEDADIIYAGNKIVFGDGVNATVKDSEGNTLAETPLTQEDKDGIRKAQEQKQGQATTETKSTAETKGTTDTSNKQTGTTNKTTDNRVKPVTPSTPDLKPSNPSKPVEPIAPVDPIKPVEPEKPTNPEQPTNPTDPEKPTTPEVEKTDVEVSYVDVDTMEVVTSTKETIELDKDGKGELIATTPKGYELVGDTHASITKDVKTVKFEVKKVEEAKEVSVQVIYQEVDTEGQVVKLLGADTIAADEGSNVKAEAKAFDGYTLTSNPTQVAENVKDGDKITFNYTKDDAPYVPVNTNEYQTIKKDTEGNILESTDGYTFVSKSTDKGEIIYTAPNGDTTTLYTTTEIWQKNPTDHSHVNGDGLAVGEWNGVYYGEKGNSGRVFKTQEEADYYAKTELAKDFNGFTGYKTWSVRVAGTNEILITVEFLRGSAEPDTPVEPANPVDPEYNYISKDGLIVGKWNEVYYGEKGNSGRVFKTQGEADQYAKAELAKAFTIYTGYKTWPVRVAGTNEILITVQFETRPIDPEKPYVPKHTEETVTVNKDDAGKSLTDTDGYKEISASTDEGVTTTQSNGDTHTVYTKTVVWHKPVHTEQTVVVNKDEAGNILNDTTQYDRVSESTDNGVTTEKENGDTHTVFTKTILWKGHVEQKDGLWVGVWNGVYYGEKGNVWRLFDTQADANRYAESEIATNHSIYKDYQTWPVRIAGTNQIKITVNLIKR